LPARRDPYWGPQIKANLHIGFRKTEGGSETWIARFKREDKSRKFKPLGPVESLEYDDAVEKARAWWKDLERGIDDGTATVESACRAYVEERRIAKSAACAHDNNRRFERTVYGKPFGRIPLSKLKMQDIQKWRGAQAEPTTSETETRSRRATANRMLTALRAALNYAVKARMVSAVAAVEWTNVEQLDKAGNARDLVLTLPQRRALLKAAEGITFPKHADKAGALRDLIEASMLTGRRAGELVKATRSQFDAHTGSMRFTGKTGTKIVPLSAAAAKLFTRLSKSKLPSAFLFVRDDGRQWAHSDWDGLVRDAAKRAGLPVGVCLYTLRHTFISLALTEGGIATSDVAYITGTSTTMIERNYKHVLQEHVRRQLTNTVMA
jgi:integrase